MSDSTNEAKNVKAELAAAKAKARAFRPWYQKKRFIIPGALLALVIVSSSLNGGGGSSSTNPSTNNSTEEVETEAPATEASTTECLSVENISNLIDENAPSYDGDPNPEDIFVSPQFRYSNDCDQDIIGLKGSVVFEDIEIGRASCRERV